MNPTVLAMRRPVTTLMMVVALISGGALAYDRMRVDIFPSLNTPKVYVYLDYVGMSPDQMEGFIVNQLELYFQYVDGIKDINSTEHPAGRPLRTLVLPRDRDGPGDGPGRGDVRPLDVVDAQGHPAADDHADGRRQRPGRLPRLREREDVARGDGRPGPERHPAAGPEERPRHGRDLAVRPEHAVDRHQRRPAEALDVQPERRSRSSRPWPRGTRSSRRGTSTSKTRCRWSPTTRLVVRHQAAGRASPSRWAGTSTSATSRPSETTPTSPMATPWSTARSRSTCRSSRRTPGSTLTVVADVRKSMHLFRDAVPKDVEGQLRVRRVAHGAGGRRERGLRRGDRRGPDRPDDPPVPGRLAERDRRGGQHPAGPAGVACSGSGSPATRSTSCPWAGWPWRSASSSTRRR